MAKRGIMKITFSLNWTVLHAQCTCALSSVKKKLSYVMCLIACNICWDRYPINTVRWLLLQAWRRTTPVFHTATDTVTDLANTLTQSMWVTDNRMLCSLPRSCLMHPVDRFDREGWFNSDQVIFLNCVSCFWWKSMQHLSEKTSFLGFLFPKVVQKH